MKDLLVICPTRERPLVFEEMLKSFIKNTSPKTVLLVVIDQDDPTLEEYMKIIHKDVIYRIQPRCTITEIFNQSYLTYPHYKFYSCTNDDFVYHTPHWDLKLMEKDGISYGNDLFQGQNLPTTSVISGDIVRRLGWLQNPQLGNLYGDQTWKIIGETLNCLYYRDDVIIEHKHVFTGKAKTDNIYQQTNSSASYQRDREKFIKWLVTQYHLDIERIKNAS